MNACYSGGNVVYIPIVEPWPVFYETDIPRAFGNQGAVEDDKTYVGWLCSYYPNTVGAGGTAWTDLFWDALGTGYTVTQASNDASDWYVGWMATYLYLYGGQDGTTLTW